MTMSTPGYEGKDPREMSVKETMKWTQDLITSLSGTNSNACSFEAVKQPVRRKILHLLEEKPLDIEALSARLDIDKAKLKYHLNILQNAYFIRMKGDMVDLTPGGLAVVRADKAR